ncbi:MAG TPA: hypothetical protein VLI54_06610 [Bacillota bacterium]|nr:hypothetical protein [Bacillota bacterium]
MDIYKPTLVQTHEPQCFEGIKDFEGFVAPRYAASNNEPRDDLYRYAELYPDGTLRLRNLDNTDGYGNSKPSDLLSYNPITGRGIWRVGYYERPDYFVREARELLASAGVPEDALNNPLVAPSTDGLRTSYQAGGRKSAAQLCVATALRGLQSSRWYQYEYDEPQADESDEHYARALGVLVDRFGEGVLADESVGLIDYQLRTLHMHVHTPESGENKPHSDGPSEDEKFADVAYQAINGAHYIPANLYHGHIANYVSIFGDTAFWKAAREQHGSVFSRAVEHLASIAVPYLQTHFMYNNQTFAIDPVGLIKDHYPAAYAEIIIARPDFTPQLNQAIEAVAR